MQAWQPGSAFWCRPVHRVLFFVLCNTTWTTQTTPAALLLQACRDRLQSRPFSSDAGLVQLAHRPPIFRSHASLSDLGGILRCCLGSPPVNSQPRASLKTGHLEELLDVCILSSGTWHRRPTGHPKRPLAAALRFRLGSDPWRIIRLPLPASRLCSFPPEPTPLTLTAQSPDSTPPQVSPVGAFALHLLAPGPGPISDPASTSSGLSPGEEMWACDPERAMFRELGHAVSSCSCNDCRLAYLTGVNMPSASHPCGKGMPLKANESQRTHSFLRVQHHSSIIVPGGLACNPPEPPSGDVANFQWLQGQQQMDSVRNPGAV